MYYDDINHGYDDDDDNNSYFTDAWSDYDKNNRVKGKPNETKMADKGYYYYRKWYNQKPLKVEMYDSGNSLGYRIRCPLTGSRLSARVGSNSEKDFFKVRWCGLNRLTPVTLYYDSPEQYERHHKTSLPVTIKEKWWREHRTTDRPHPILGDSVAEGGATVVLPGSCQEVAVTVVK